MSLTEAATGAGDWLLALGAAKPVLTALVLPPLAPLLVLLLGLWLVWRKRPQVSWVGRGCIGLGVAVLWLLSCQSSAVWLARHVLPQYPAANVSSLQAQQVQAVVVLGGGIETQAPEYGSAQLSAPSMERLRYGVWLARGLQVPLVFSGGVGWSHATGASQAGVPAEATIAQEVAQQTLGYPLALAEAVSRDTRENGQFTAALLKSHGMTRIALVTHAWHMPRAMQAFVDQGLTVQAAPMGFTAPYERPLLNALPSGHGLAASRRVLREWFGLLLT